MTRDPRYDGVFFTGVKSTGVYCRPICAVRKPLAKNVVFYATASAAEAAGFRPCLRCRPETAPFSPAWNGTKTTTNRALKLIHDGALDRTSLDQFSERLGVGTRHLTRLFRKHVGATPTQVALTMRIQRAKRLLDESDLSMAEIADQAGFSSVRRFNAGFKKLYGRSPSELRRK